MLFPHLLHRKSFVTESGELDKFFLDRLQSFLPLTVSDVGFCSLLASKPMLFIQALNVGDFRPKTSYLFPQNFKMIHRCQDNNWREIAIALKTPVAAVKRLSLEVTAHFSTAYLRAL